MLARMCLVMVMASATVSMPHVGVTVTADPWNGTTNPGVVNMSGTTAGSGSPVTVNGVIYGWSGGTPAAGVFGCTTRANCTGTGALTPYAQNAAGAAGIGLTGSAANFFAAEPGGNVTASFTPPIDSYSLLWGSIDKSNSLIIELYSDSTLVGTTTITGGDVGAAAGFTAAQYRIYAAVVTISSTAPFNKIVFVAHGSPAFEFVPIRETVPLALLGKRRPA